MRRVWHHTSAASGSPEFPQATHAEIGPLLGNIRKTLTFIEFFKFEGAEQSVMRAVASIVNRARLDTREVRILHGIFSEVRGFCQRLAAKRFDG